MTTYSQRAPFYNAISTVMPVSWFGIIGGFLMVGIGGYRHESATAAVPKYTMMYGPDGRTLISKRPTGTRIWEIKGSQGRPFTTVNTAIRYVLEQRDKAQQPVIRKNADEALHILMRLD